MPRIAMVLLLLVLLGGTSAAFALTQSLKNEHSPVGVPRFDRVLAPECDCPSDVAELRLRLRKADRVTAEIVNADGESVRVLADAERARRGPLTLEWDGRSEEGAVVPDGRYRLRIELAREGRTILLPTTIRVDTRAPRVRILNVKTSAERLRVVYRANDRAAGQLSITGEELPETVVVRGRFRRAGKAGLNWSWQLDGEPLPPGEYTVSLRVRDKVGNLSEPQTIMLARTEVGGQIE